MNKKILHSLILILILVSSTNPVSGEIFSGIGDKTTGTFTSSTYTKVTWSTTASNDFDAFSAFIYKQGESIYDSTFDGSQGTTYIYDVGTFYFDVFAANLDNWQITTTPTDGDYFTDSVSGEGNSNTALFECFGECEITWTTVEENSYALFSVFIEPIDDDAFFFKSFDGASGNTFLYETGIYYFQVLAANLISWTININITSAKSTSTTSTDDVGSQSTSDNSSDLSSTGEVAFGFTGIVSMIAITITMFVKSKVKKKRKV